MLYIDWTCSLQYCNKRVQIGSERYSFPPHVWMLRGSVIYNELTSWGRVILEKLRFTQPRNSLYFKGLRSSLQEPATHFYTELDESIPNPLPILILILSSLLHLCLPSGIICSGLLTKICMNSSPTQLTWFDHSNTIQWIIQIMKFCTKQFSPPSFHFFCMSRVQFPTKARFFPFPRCQDCLWGPPILLSNGYWGPFPWK